MTRKLFVIVLTVVVLFRVSLSNAEVLNHLSFAPSSAPPISGSVLKVSELEIDSSLSIQWDQPAFLADVARRLGYSLSGESLVPQIEELKREISQAVELQRLLIQVKSVTLKLNRAKSLGETDLKTLTESFNAANKAFGEAGVPLLKGLRNKYRANPALYKQLSGAILANDYDPLGAVLSEEAARLGALLAQRISEQGQVEVQMTATLVSSDGVSRAVHLDGYDHYDVVGPVPFNRFQTTIDERTANEMAAAESMAALIKKAQSGALREEAVKALKELSGAIKDLQQALKSDVLVKNLDELLSSLLAAGESNLSPLYLEALEVRNVLKMLTETPTFEATTDADRLIELVGTLQEVVNRLRALASVAPSSLDKFIADLEKELKERPGIVSEDFLSVLNTSFTKLKGSNKSISEILSDAESVLSALGFVGSLGEAIDQSLQKPRTLLTDSNLDTRLDLQTIPGARHAGDRLNIMVTVSRNKTIIDSGRKSFRLEVFGAYLETRGSLLMVNPRDKLAGGQDFEPAPGLAFNLHYGMKDSPFLNHIIHPGIGVSLAMLDFDDNKSLEIGIGANITLFNDIFWVGYGYNLQAKVDYFYIGINPLVVGRLFSQTSGFDKVGQ